MKVALKYWLTAAVVVFFTAACAQFLLFSDKASIDNSVSIWFDKADPELASYEQYNQTFGDSEWTSILLKTPAIYTPRFLQQLNALSHDLEQTAEIFRVVSIANAEESVSRDGELSYERLLSDERIDAGLSGGEVQQFKDRLLSNTVLADLLVKPGNEQYSIILVKNGNYLNRQDDYRIRLEDSIAAAIGQYDSIESYSMVGTTILNANLNRTSLRDVYVYYTGITLMLCLLGFVIFRTLRDVLVLVLVVGSSLIVSMGGLAALSIPYNMVTVMLPTCVVAISTSTVIHVIDTFRTFAIGQSLAEARINTIAHLMRPTLLTTGTTVLGFLSLCFSSVLPIVQLGAFVSLGLVYAWLVSIFVVPHVLEKLHASGVPRKKIGEQSFHRVMGFFTPRRSLLLLFVLLLPILGIKDLRVDTDYSEFFGSSHPLSTAYDEFDRVGFGQNPIALTYSFSAGSAYDQVSNGQQIARFEQRLLEDKRVVSSLTVASILQQAHDAFSMAPAGSAQVVDMNGDTLAQTLLLAQSSGNKDLEDLYRTNSVQSLVLTPYMSSQQLKAFIADIHAIARETLGGGVQLAVNGTTVLWANMDQAVSQTQLTSLIFMTLVIFATLLYLRCSLKVAIAATLINIVPLLIIFGVMGLFDIPINLATAIIAGILLGVMVDDTIHVVSSINRLAEQGATPAQAAEQTTLTTGLTLFKTTVVLMGCFLILTTSNFVPTENFGWLVGFGLLMAVTFDLLFLPWLLVRLMPNVRRFSYALSK
jgi:predicted RND superfamily exporter protein